MRNPQHRVYPYLLRGDRTGTERYLGCDITSIRLRGGWLYLVAIIDWYSRYVISWQLDDTLELGFVLDAIAQARAQAWRIIWNTDQGSHFTSPQGTEPWIASGVQGEYGWKGRALDNIFTERLWRSVKHEEVYLKDYTSPRAARWSAYVTFYNSERPHQARTTTAPSRGIVERTPMPR